MPSTIIDGKSVSQSVLKQVAREVTKLKRGGIYPKLAFILVGKNPGSLAYVGQKEKACEKTGILYEHIGFPETVSEKKLLQTISKLNRDKKVHGILVQLPLPSHIDPRPIIRAIDPRKDVDGFHAVNEGRLFLNDPPFLSPCTPTGVMKLLHAYKIQIEGKYAVVVGKSNIVGKPLALMLLNAGATVTVCHSKTKNTAEITRKADILCVAAGVPSLIKGNMVKKGCTVIDVGFTRVGGKILGDVLFDSVKKKASFITPVPGGVGPMTVACLMENVVKAAKQA